MDINQLSESQFILIRHGMSEFNFKAKVTETERGSEEYNNQIKNSLDLIDPDLHSIGIIQCDIHKSITDQIHTKTVFVSPIQRAIQTTIELFKHHPNLLSIKFIILPLVREILNTSNDVGIDCYDLMEKYKDGSPINKGLIFDFH